jgi:hypothetical protein
LRRARFRNLPADEAKPADDHMMAADAAFDAFTRRFNDIAGDREFETLVSRVIHDGLRHDVFGSLIE